MRRVWKAVAGVGVAAVLAAGGAVAYVAHGVASIPRFSAPSIDPSGSAAPQLSVAPTQKGKPQTFLLFSVGSQGLTADKGRALDLPGWRANYADGLTDVLMVITVNPQTGKAGVLSIPRDTWLAQYHQKINALYNLYGAETLKREVEGLTGIPVNHVVSVNFTAFADLTDEVNGVNVYVPKPSRDAESGLNVPAGCVHMDGKTALAWVRSRYTDTQDAYGRWSRDPSASDWGRIRRQHDYLHALVAKLLNPELPLRVPALLGVAHKNLVFDDSLGLTDLTTLASAFSGSSGNDMEMYTYPTTAGRVGDQSVVFAHPDQAVGILNRLKSGLTASSAAPSTDTPTSGLEASAAVTPSASPSGHRSVKPSPSRSATPTAAPTPDTTPASCAQ